MLQGGVKGQGDTKGQGLPDSGSSVMQAAELLWIGDYNRGEGHAALLSWPGCRVSIEEIKDGGAKRLARCITHLAIWKGCNCFVGNSASGCAFFPCFSAWELSCQYGGMQIP